jgi:hypothetical protein
MKPRHSVTVLRDYAQEANNMAFHLENEAVELRRQADAKAVEAAELRLKAKSARADADRLEGEP